jgi:hypothetical protein
MKAILSQAEAGSRSNRRCSRLAGPSSKKEALFTTNLGNMPRDSLRSDDRQTCREVKRLESGVERND